MATTGGVSDSAGRASAPTQRQMHWRPSARRVNVVPALTPHPRDGHNRRSAQASNVSFRERGDRRDGDGRAGTVILVLSVVAIVLMILLL